MLLELLTDAMTQERSRLDALRQIAEHGGLDAVWNCAILQHRNVSHQHSVTLCAFLGVHEVLQKSRAASCMSTAFTYTRAWLQITRAESRAWGTHSKRLSKATAYIEHLQMRQYLDAQSYSFLVEPPQQLQQTETHSEHV